ncbi:K02A2.6-like, partial [Cordylochernes scorpioides]
MYLQIPPPEPVNFRGNIEENWRYFKSHWRNFSIATGLDNKEDKLKVATLLSIIGKEAYNIFEHLDLSDEQRNNSDEIINALTQHFTPKINIIYERSIFNQTNQETNESIEQYICRLRKLSSTCNYGAMTEEMIRDRLVLGIIDKQTKRQLISDPQLTLQKAIDVCKANESANKQIENLTKNTQEEVNKLNIRKKTVNQNKMKKNIPCRYCATFHEHNRQKCPAWNQTCRKCNKKNHWAKVCKSRMRTVQSLESQNSNDEQEDCYSLEYVSEISARKLMTKSELELNGYKESIICQIDTGATVNVLNFADLCKIMQDGNPSLKPSHIKLRCYGGEILKPRGQIKINCSHQSKQHPIVFQVIDHWEKPILSAETCQKLNLIEIKADLCKIESTWTKQNNLLDKYKDIFEGIGCLQGEYKLETDPTIKPIKQAPRRVPITLRKELKEKLIDMEKKNIIAKVDYPTDWISNLVLVKSTKKLRICIDPRELNVALKRAEYPIPTIEEIIPNLQNAKIFTVVDTKDGFWNVKLSDESSNLTTFWTPFGRYKFLRMPFGLKTASEEYQRRLYEIFQGLEGIEIIADDILILGKGDSYEEALKDHDRNLENLFKTARQANLKFNINKVKLRLKEVKYLGHIITPHGLKPDPEKVKALKEMPHPESITELKSFLGFATYLCKFMPNISMISEPLRKLTMKNSTWSWSKNHQAAFEQIKDLASKAPVLRYFDADKSIAIQCDASKHGLGATLLQESQPIIFASRSLSKTEQNYAQIEKECLAIVFACERFHQYILGKCQVIVQTDHKPLLSIFKKSILKAPQRLQRMLLRLQRYNLELEHVQGSQMHLADIFSRACIKDVRNENLKYDVYPIDIIYKEIATVNVMETLSVCSDTVLRIREETSSDPILCEVKKLILNGWPPNKNQTSMLTREYWNFREELTVQDGIILKNDRIVIPNKLRAEMIMKTHQGHIGINSSMRRARDNIFWPGMNAQIRQEIENCSICLSNSQNQVREPMKSHRIPNYPWERISLDIFEIFKQNYLIIVDHYSDFFEVGCLENTTSEYIIECCKRQFSRYGIPQIIVSDNGRQFTSTEFQKFSKEWQFQHSTSSPLHSQGNGKAEAAVKIAKNLLKKSKQENNKISIKRQQAKYYYDRKSKNLPDLDIGQEVYVRTPNTTPSWSKANITNEHNTRSYDVNIHGRTYRRNRTWIKPQQASANQKSTNNQEEGRKESIDQEQTVSNCLPSTSSAGGDNIVKRTRIETTECRIQLAVVSNLKLRKMETENKPSDTSEICKVSVKIPPSWVEKPEIWVFQAFVQLERVGKTPTGGQSSNKLFHLFHRHSGLSQSPIICDDKNTGLRFLVDSGADISIIPPKDKNRMPSSDYKLYAANGTEIVTYGTKVRNLDIGLRRQFQWPFVIANTNRAIIGADFLNNFGLIIDIKNKRLIDGITNLSIRGVIQSISDMGNISTLNSSSKVSAILTKYPNLCRPPADFVEAKHSVKHYIPTRGQPIHSKARRLDSQRLTLAKAEFQYMLNNGIIRPSNSPWASPLHLVSKKDESLRPCGDYRRLNAVTLPDRYPIPRLDDFHHILKGTRVYSKIDLCKTFYQIPIAEEDKPKTAIITPFGLFEFNVMNFGLRNATATFQRFMHEVLRNLDFAFVYLDDILVASKTEEEHYSHLETLFSRLNSYGLRINLSKSKFLVQEIDFLGYLITSHGVNHSQQRNFHELSHPGIKATTKQLTSRFIWPNMNKDIRKWAQACVNCQNCKVSIHTKSEIGKYQEVDKRFSVVHIDLIGPLPPSNGNIYCLTCIDRYTSWMEVVPLPDMKSETVARAFYENWIVRFGAPHTVISDHGKQFTSQLFKDLTTLCGIKLRHSTAYHPQCNGKIERLLRTIKTAIRAHNNIKWTETLPTVLLGLRAAINKDNNHSLSQMLQKQMELLKPLNEKHHSKTKVFVHKDLKTCSHVFIMTDRVKKPLEPPYEGPFPVLDRTDKYFTLKVKGRNVTISIDRLRPAYLLADSDKITSEHPTATRPIVSGALPSTSPQQNPDPPDVEKYTEFQGTGSAPDLTRTRSGRIIKKP